MLRKYEVFTPDYVFCPLFILTRIYRSTSIILCFCCCRPAVCCLCPITQHKTTALCGHCGHVVCYTAVCCMSSVCRLPLALFRKQETTRSEERTHVVYFFSPLIVGSGQLLRKNSMRHWVPRILLLLLLLLTIYMYSYLYS